jgi:hypothetical protein
VKKLEPKRQPADDKKLCDGLEEECPNDVPVSAQLRLSTRRSQINIAETWGRDFNHYIHGVKYLRISVGEYGQMLGRSPGKFYQKEDTPWADKTGSQAAFSRIILVCCK